MTAKRIPPLAIVIVIFALAACQSATPTPEPTEVPMEEEAPAEEEPMEETMLTPAVTVSDQEIVDGTVTIAEVVSDGPGWLVVHAQGDSGPGPILGYSPVGDGANSDVLVEIDAANATGTLYAMLHTDAGEVGTFEFPDGADTPVRVNEQVVTPPFQVLASFTPSVTVSDQEIADGTVTIAEVISNGPGWLVIHAQGDSGPGPILGYSPVVNGTNSNVLVEIDGDNATETLYAMLHTDAGEVGTFEFPDGSDTPVRVDEQVVTPPFQVTLAVEVMTGTVEVELFDASFSPKEVTVAVGTTVSWINNEDLPHTVTADDGAFDSGELQYYDVFEFTFTEAGTYAYYCDYHGGSGGQGMSGVITVVEN